MKVFLDVETCGLYGMPVLLQYAVDDEPVVMVDLWKQPIKETLGLLRWIADQDVIGFNLAFDWFHLCKLYTTFDKFEDHDALPEDHIDELAVCEYGAGQRLCYKPKRACDIMLHARKGPYQSLMAREKIRIKRVPTSIAWELAAELEKRVVVDDIYFARRKDISAPKWSVFDCKDPETGEDQPQFKNVVLRFSPSGALKALAAHALNIPAHEILKFKDVELPKMYFPVELGYAPYAMAVGMPGDWKKSWPQMIRYHISHWAFNSLARKYATDDVEYTRALYKHFGSPEPGDNDSTLACMVAAVRWRGFKIDIPAMKELRKRARKKYASTPLDPKKVRAYLFQVMAPLEQKILEASTKKVLLEEVADWVCLECEGNRCESCNHTGKHPAAIRAKEVLMARQGKKQDELYGKLIHAGRFYASFVVIGTLSSRMAGADKLNPQAINAMDIVRDCFPLADEGFDLCGGDFDAFEVVLADAVYNDENLRLDLKSGKKIHALFATQIYPKETYETIMASKGTEFDMYHNGKTGVFALVYGGNEMTLKKKLKIPLELGLAAFNGFLNKYIGIGRNRKKTEAAFCTMKQDGALGSRITWADPAEYVESIFGFRRYFTLENSICRALFNLASNLPPNWKKYDGTIVRNVQRGAQKIAGAVCSALYAAAFGLQGVCFRAAVNHEIQSSGAEITKHVQRAICDIQPHGAHEWIVVPMNVHDEILSPTKPAYVAQVAAAVNTAVESFRGRVPLIKMEWASGLESWSKGLTKGKVKKIRELRSQGVSEADVAKAVGMKIEELAKERDWP